MSITLANGDNELKFKTTIFSDKTSQVWQIEGDVTEDLFTIHWDFESEAEIMQIFQLATLIRQLYPKCSIGMGMDYLPYARQDKAITNDSTFALKVFTNLLKASGLFDYLNALDIHNPKAVPEIDNDLITVTDVLNIILANNKVDVICFPDKGATSRGYPTFDLPLVILDKKRNQLTGDIEGLKFAEETIPDFNGKTILIIDDLCDGGRTFTEAAKLLKGNGAAQVYLYTTHGIYSKGTQTLFDNGLDKVFNWKQEVTK